MIKIPLDLNTEFWEGYIDENDKAVVVNNGHLLRDIENLDCLKCGGILGQNPFP